MSTSTPKPVTTTPGVQTPTPSPAAIHQVPADTVALPALHQPEKSPTTPTQSGGNRDASQVTAMPRREEGKKKNDFDKTTRPPRKDDERRAVPTTHDRGGQRPNAPVTPSTTGSRSLEDLRSVLARISTAEKKEAPASTASGHTHTQPAQSSKAAPQKADLASALQKIGAVSSAVGTPVNDAGAVVSSDQKHKLSANQPILKTEPVHIQKELVAPAVSTSDHHDELRRLVDETEAAFALLESTTQTGAATAKPQGPDDPLAPKKIEQMFRQPRNERSPFTS